MKGKNVYAVFALCVLLAGCENSFSGNSIAKSGTPTANTTTFAIARTGQMSVEVLLSSTVNGEWKVYNEGALSRSVSAFFMPTTNVLKLSSKDKLLPSEYKVTVTEKGKSESDPLTILLWYPAAMPSLADPFANSVDLESAEQTSVTFTLGEVIPGALWVVYDAETGGGPVSNVKAEADGSTLTLSAVPDGAPLPGGTYYIAVIAEDEAESPRLALTVNAYNPNRTIKPDVSASAYT